MKLEQIIITNGLVAEGFLYEITSELATFQSGFCEGIEFEAFAFDLEFSEEVDVLYEVYLAVDGVYVERFELYPGTTPSYTGDSELVHFLSAINLRKDGTIDGTIRLSKEQK